MDYIAVCLHNHVSGGPEALHQFMAALRAQGRSASMVYLPLDPANRCHPRYEHYGVPVRHELVDREDQLIVVPETMTQMVLEYRRARLLIWWLSVDNYFKTVPTGRWRWFKNRVRGLWGGQRFYSLQKSPRLLHAYQSEYAREFLAGRGIHEALPLTDYIPAASEAPGAASESGRRDVCLYNPLKGAEFTARLIAHCQGLGLGIEFLALKGFNEAQMKEHFATAKAYIDFGEHPGRDRIPREAALGGCVVVTGRLGSAANTVDVPLPDDYKVDQSRPDALAHIAALLADLMQRHGSHAAAQQAYVQQIRGQRELFQAEAAALAARAEGLQQR
jgi:hypothetical protein